MKHKAVGYMVFAALFAVLGLVAGHFSFTGGGDRLSFVDWLTDMRYHHIRWALGGALVGLGVRHVIIKRKAALNDKTAHTSAEAEYGRVIGGDRRLKLMPSDFEHEAGHARADRERHP